MKRNSNHLLAAVLASLFGLFLIYGSLTSSDFPRGLYGPPQIHSGDGHWSDFAALNPNRVWNYASQWHSFGDAGKNDYLDSLEEYNLKAILRNGDWKGNDTTGSYTDSIPYLVEHYSCGQHKQLEAEMTYDDAERSFFEEDGLGFYHFQHYQGRLDQTSPVSWSLDPDLDYSGNAIYGPYSTIDGEESAPLNEPKFDAGGYGYTSRSFEFRVRSKIDTSGYSVSSDDMVYQLIVTTHFLSGSSVESTLICRVGDYSVINDFEEDTIQVTVTPSGSDKFTYFRYRIRYEDHVRLWIDWIEYMDMEQAYPLFANDTLKAQTFAQIDNQCDSFEQDLQHGDEIIGWAQSDEPKMSTFDAHGIINDYMIGQNHRMPQLPFRLQGDFGPLGCKHFALVAKPRAFDFDIYPFLGPPNQIGDQTELDTLAAVLDSVYSACGGTIHMIYTAQVHSWYDSSSQAWSHRDPRRSEIFAAAFMALAHGAKGITFYKYPSGYSTTTGDSSWGLVNNFDGSFSHDPEDPHFLAEKWQAVQDVFAQLDSIGDTLLLLDRRAAFCANEGGFLSPIDNVFFEEEESQDSAWIEVGQFYGPGNTDYLILVNRRTDADRHITVETNLPHTYALRDIYTQERFISSTGDFKAIPFEAGQGRVFKIEYFADNIWDSSDQIVLADTFLNVTPFVNITVSAGATIKATSEGWLNIIGQGRLVCHGTSQEPVSFGRLESDRQWQGLSFNRSGASIPTDTLLRTNIEGTESAAIAMHGGARLYMSGSTISDVQGAGISCDGSDLTMESSAITNCGGHGLVLDNSKAEIYNDSICYNGNGGPSGIFAVMGSVPKIGDTHLSYNDRVGISCYNSGTIAVMLRSSAYAQCGRNSIVGDSLYGVMASNEGYPYLGYDSDRQGLNSIYDNGLYDVKNNNNSVIWAEYNWWGQNPQFYGWVDTSHALSAPPGDSFIGGSSLAHRNMSRGADGPSPGSLSEANRLNNVAVELFLDGEYYAAVDTFALVVNNFPGTAPARFALNHLVVCYREADDYAGAVAYLNEFLQPPIDPTLAPLALYHKVLNLARLQEYPAAIAIAGNTQLMATMPQDLQEPLMIELGMMQKYGMQNVFVGNGVFEQFLQQFPESPLAPIAAMELGLEWGSQGIYGSGAAAGIGTAELPEEFYLEQNHPNPFNPTTTITFGLPVASWVKVDVFDIAGRLLGWSGSGTTPTTDYFLAGVHEVTFDGSNLPSGIYVYRIRAGEWTESSKMILLK